MSSTVLLEVRGLKKSFGGLEVLRNISLSVYEGEIAGLIGPNGAGKTTLFNVINGILPPDSGEIRFDGRSLTGATPHRVCRAGIARTFQTGRAFLSMSVLENILVGAHFGPAAGKSAPGDKEERAKEILRFLELEEKQNTLVAHLNPMERKMVELGRALANGPRLILMDELLAGLNQKELPRVAAIILRIRQAHAVTVFWVEHIMTTLMGTCDRIIVLHQGEKLTEGRPEEIVEDPRVKEAYLGSKAHRIQRQSS